MKLRFIGECSTMWKFTKGEAYSLEIDEGDDPFVTSDNGYPIYLSERDDGHWIAPGYESYRFAEVK